MRHQFSCCPVRKRVTNRATIAALAPGHEEFAYTMDLAVSLTHNTLLESASTPFDPDLPRLQSHRSTADPPSPKCNRIHGPITLENRVHDGTHQTELDGW